jgi:hypothetical protein
MSTRSQPAAPGAHLRRSSCRSTSLATFLHTWAVGRRQWALAWLGGGRWVTSEQTGSGRLPTARSLPCLPSLPYLQQVVAVVRACPDPHGLRPRQAGPLRAAARRALSCWLGRRHSAPPERKWHARGCQPASPKPHLYPILQPLHLLLQLLPQLRHRAQVPLAGGLLQRRPQRELAGAVHVPAGSRGPPARRLQPLGPGHAAAQKLGPVAPAQAARSCSPQPLCGRCHPSSSSPPAAHLSSSPSPGASVASSSQRAQQHSKP